MTLSRSEARSILRRMGTLIGGPVNRGSFFSALEVDAELLSTPRIDRKKKPLIRSRSRGDPEFEEEDDEEDYEDAAERRRRRRSEREREREQEQLTGRSSLTEGSSSGRDREPEAVLTVREKVRIIFIPGSIVLL